jgi:hypothetical protein
MCTSVKGSSSPMRTYHFVPFAVGRHSQQHLHMQPPLRRSSLRALLLLHAVCGYEYGTSTYMYGS